jgi:protein-disulfide isomerase
MMFRFAVLFLVTAFGFAFQAEARAAAFSPEQRAEIIAIVRDALKKDPSILRDAITALQDEEDAHKTAAAKAALANAHDRLITPADPVAGNPKGDVTIVEFFDTRCPYCRRMEPVMEQFLAQDRNVRLIYKDLPILGPASTLGSKALLASQKQNGYDKMREAVMKLPSDTTQPMIQKEAERLGLDWPQLLHDMQDPAVQQRLDANLKLARELGIQGTPALVIGSELIPGAVGLDDLKRAVDDARHTRG